MNLLFRIVIHHPFFYIHFEKFKSSLNFDKYLKHLQVNEYIINWDEAKSFGLYKGEKVKKEEEKEVSDRTLIDRDKTKEEHKADIAKRHKKFQEELKKERREKRTN